MELAQQDAKAAESAGRPFIAGFHKQLHAQFEQEYERLRQESSAKLRQARYAHDLFQSSSSRTRDDGHGL